MADISFACPRCTQILEAPDDMVGEVVECPACQHSLTIPGPETAARQEAGETPEAASKCPSCGTAMEADAVLCVDCGFHIKLGKKISTSLG
jgi:DNA-directed RNA polymerase subunit RPC12/RpoP